MFPRMLAHDPDFLFGSATDAETYTASSLRPYIVLPYVSRRTLRQLPSHHGRSVSFWMTGNRALDSCDSGALPGRSTSMVSTPASVAASASVYPNVSKQLMTEWYAGYFDCGRSRENRASRRSTARDAELGFAGFCGLLRRLIEKRDDGGVSLKGLAKSKR